MDCFDTILAYTNMHSFFKQNLKVKFSKNILEIHVYAQVASTISICSCPCQPMILSIKFASHVFCILRKLSRFLEIGNSAGKHIIYV